MSRINRLILFSIVTKIGGSASPDAAGAEIFLPGSEKNGGFPHYEKARAEMLEVG
jgi:hypothetical protein